MHAFFHKPSNWPRIFVFILVAAECLATRAAGQNLETAISVHKKTLWVGEPLVVAIVATNKGAELFQTPYSRSQRFQDASSAFLVMSGRQTVLRVNGGGSGAKVLSFSDSFLRATGQPEAGVPPGGVLRAKKVLPLSAMTKDGKRGFLEPGSYTVKGVFQITVKHGSDLQWITLETPETTFSVQAPDEGARRAVELLGSFPYLDLFLQGRSGKPSAEIIGASDKLKQQYPSLPHFKYLEARFVQAQLQNPPPQ